MQKTAQVWLFEKYKSCDVFNTDVDQIRLDVRYEVLMAMKIQVEIFWVVTLCSVVAAYHDTT